MRKVFAVIVCFLLGTLFVLLVRNSCQIERYWFAPERPSPRPGWENVRKGDAVYLGEFVLNRGEAAENDGVGVEILSLQPPPCPPPDSFDTDGSRARFRFYRASDRETLCEVELEQSSTAYELGHFCGAKLPFREISVDSINAGEGWVSFVLYNLDASGE